MVAGSERMQSENCDHPSESLSGTPKSAPERTEGFAASFGRAWTTREIAVAVSIVAALGSLEAHLANFELVAALAAALPAVFWACFFISRGVSGTEPQKLSHLTDHDAREYLDCAQQWGRKLGLRLSAFVIPCIALGIVVGLPLERTILFCIPLGVSVAIATGIQMRRSLRAIIGRATID